MSTKSNLLETIEQKLAELINLIKGSGSEPSNASNQLVQTETVGICASSVDDRPSKPAPGDFGVGAVLVNSESQVRQVERQGLYAMSLNGLLTRSSSLEGDLPSEATVAPGSYYTSKPWSSR